MAKSIASQGIVHCVLFCSCYATLFQSVVTTNTTTSLASHVLVSKGQTLVSPGQVFELGFFSPSNSTAIAYLGLWYKNITPQTVVWVANRESPLSSSDTTASLSIGSNGNLRLLDGNQNTLWSTNISSSGSSNGLVVQLSDAGDLTLVDNSTGVILWQSFQDPCDVLLPDMLLGVNEKTGQNTQLSSWTSQADPSPGDFTTGLLPKAPVQAFIWNGEAIHWRSGPWDGGKFVGIEDTDGTYIDNFEIQQNQQAGTIYLTYNTFSNTTLLMLRLSSSGSLVATLWVGTEWLDAWDMPSTPCDVYGTCGPFGMCNPKKSPICTCLKGFVPTSSEEWSKGNWTSGCTRGTELVCQKNFTGNSTSGTGVSVGFLQMSSIKLPDNYLYLASETSQAACESFCHDNCSCIAYSYVSGIIGCLVWTEDLVDMQQFASSGEQLYVKLPSSELVGRDQRFALIISLPVAILTIAFFLVLCALCKKSRKIGKRQGMLWYFSRNSTKRARDHAGKPMWDDHLEEADSYEVPSYKFDDIALATHNFNEANRLGQGGFGAVFKGKLEDGREIAVKRLSRRSGQGIKEFKNEIVLISKLQHRNLVRTLGFCTEGEEKLIVYEYMANGSLNTFLFDSKKKEQLPWSMRFNIIEGIARGLLYLHRDSRLRVIHRDMKASNVLLDKDVTPKISDFGLARTFLATEDSAHTRRVVGTFGYMSPEYAMRGIFSEKSDVFSFGILLLEIISGRKNTGFIDNDLYLNLPGYAWQLWRSGRGVELTDEVLLTERSYSDAQVMRCLSVALLCVQDYSVDRPTMSAVVFMLSSDASLPCPKKPTFFPQSLSSIDQQQSNPSDGSSINECTMTASEGR